MKTMSAMAIWKMKTIEVLKNVNTDHDDYPVANVEVKFLDSGVRVGVIAREEGCILLCDDCEGSDTYFNAYWFCEDEELEIGMASGHNPDSYYLDDDMIDNILNQTDAMLDYLAQ